MTGDQVPHDHDDLEFDDDEFILDDWDEGLDSGDDDSEDIFAGVDEEVDRGASASDEVTLDADTSFMPPAEDDEDAFGLDEDEPSSAAELLGRSVIEQEDDGDLDSGEAPQLAAAGEDDDMFAGIDEEVDAELATQEESSMGPGENPLKSMFESAAGARRNLEDRGIPEDQVGSSDRLESAEEDELFQAHEAQSETLINPEGKKPPFDEESTEPWGGEDVELDQMGIEMSAAGDDFDAEEPALAEGLHEDDLEVVDLDDGPISPAPLAASVGAVDFAEDEGFDAEEDEPYEVEEISDELTDENYTVTEDQGEFEAGEEDDPEWAPVGDDPDEDEVYEERYEGDEDFGFEEEQEADYSEHEEYFEESGVAQAKAPRRRSPAKMFFAAAAVVLVSAAGAVYHFKPEWLTPAARVEPRPIEVVKVDRPSTDLEIDKPTGLQDDPGQKDPAQKDPAQKDPAQKDPAQKDPAQKDPAQKDPAQKDPEQKDPEQKDPEQKDPEQKDPEQKDPEQKDPQQRDPEQRDPEQAESWTEDPGFLLTNDVKEQVPLFRDRVDETNLRGGIVQPEAGLVMGSSALAQLYNDNIFVGTVKKMDAGFVTLRMRTGEITLDRREVRVLTPLGNAEAREFASAASSGYVRLRNSNRLKGKIVEARDDSVVLELNANRVIIPKSAIEEIAADTGKPVTFGADETMESDDWVTRKVEEQRRKIEEAKKVKGKVRVKMDKAAQPQR